MCEWEGPVRKTFRNMWVAILFTVILMAISIFVIGTILDYIISAVVLFMFVYIPVLAYRTYQLPKVSDHFFSRWDLDPDVKMMGRWPRRKGHRLIRELETDLGSLSR